MTDEATVRVLDLGIVKSAADSTFVGGATMAYTLSVRSSEFVDSSSITITDVIPDGMCPVLPAGVNLTGELPRDCPQPGAGTETVTGATIAAVAFNAATGESTVTFELVDLGVDGDATVTYSVFMRDRYQSGTPTATGDEFTNTVTVSGTAENVDGTEPIEVTNGSSATLGTTDVTLSKTIWANESRTPITAVSGAGSTCQSGTYTSSATDLPTYQLGDLVCFRVEATFPEGVSTRSVTVSDYLPPGMSMVDWAAGPGNTTTITPNRAGVVPTRWVLGETAVTGGPYFVAPGAKLTLDLLARVNTVPAVAPRISGNLAKMIYTSGDGRVVNLRDQADLRLSPPPPLALDKKVNGADSLEPVQEGESLTFTIDVTHAGTDATSTDPVDTIEVWDILPAGFDCGDITTSTPEINALTDCVQQADGTRVVWELDLSAAPLTAGQSTRISYTLTVPTPLSISSSHTNTAAVTRYTPITTDGISPTRATFYPPNPVGAYPDVTKNAPEASDAASISLAGADVAKSVVSTSVTESNNDALTQSTIGEIVVWKYTATVPARTSIFNGLLVDGLPVGSTLVATGQPPPTVTLPSGESVAPGCAQDAEDFRLCDVPTDANFGTLFFPPRWSNNTDAPAEFTVTMTTRVADVAANSHGSTITNTASLTSTPTVANTGAVVRDTATASVTVVVPAPTLLKEISLTSATTGWVSNDNQRANGGQTVWYRLTAGNPSDRPPLHDTVIVDCIDSRLTSFQNLTNPAVASVSGPTAGAGTLVNGCAIGTDKYTWTLAGDLASDPAQIVYSAVVPTPIPASSTFQNTATLTGSTLAGPNQDERTLTATDDRTVTAAQPTVAKTRTLPVGSNATVVPGDTVNWRVSVTVPVGVNLYQARILDTLPTQLGLPANATFTVTCGSGWTTPCPAATRLTSLPNSQVLGVYLGDVAASETARVIYLDISSTVLTSIPATSVTATNSAVISWNTTSTTPPTAAVAGNASSNRASATVGIRHPLVSAGKSVSDATPAQGEVFSYTVIASASTAAANNKPAYNVQVVDTVPSGVIPVVSATDSTPVDDNGTVGGNGVWDAANRTITWTIPVLQPGTPASFPYFATLALAETLDGEPLENRAQVTSWDSRDSDDENEKKTYGPSAVVKAPVTPAFPKVNAEKKQLTDNPVYIGQEVQYELKLTNDGNATAVTMSAVDTLPAGWMYVAGSSQLGAVSFRDPSFDRQKLTWANFGPLTPGQSLTITYRAVAGTSVNVDHTNTVTAAEVTDATGGTGYVNGSYIGTEGTATARIDQADLEIEKEPTPTGTFTAGGDGAFTMVVTNNGGDPAVGLTVRDELDLPVGVTVTSVKTVDEATCAIADNVLTCTRGDLAVGATWTITLNLAIAADVAEDTTIPNTATVVSRTEDRTPGNNSSTAEATVATSADLQVVKDVVVPADGAPVIAGTDIEWSITLTNAGPSVSRGSVADPIVLTDELPAGINLTGVVPEGCELTDRELECAIARDMAVGESIVVTVRGTVDSSVEAGADVIVNAASVEPVTTDPVETNDSSETRTDVAVTEDLSIVKEITDPAAEVNPGDTISYTLQVRNDGPSDARGVYIDDVLPTDIAFGALTEPGNGWTATPTAEGVRFTYTPTLPAGQNAPLITYTAVLDPAFLGDADQLTNTASVSSTWQANQDTDTATPGEIDPEADLGITKTVRPTSGAEGDDVIAGETAIYTLEVTNNGPSDADRVTVTDVLPDGMSVDTLPAECTPAGQTITCVLAGGLDAGETPWTFDITVLIDPAFQGTQLDNDASVTSETTDPNPLNDEDTAELGVIQRADLSVTKVPNPATVTAGENVTWTITVSNGGPSDAQNVTLSDLLNEGLEFVSADSITDGVTCAGPGTMTCTIGTLPAGGSVEITLVTTVLSSVVSSTIPNAATATSPTRGIDTGEPSTATGNGEIDVVTRSELTIDKSTTTPVVSAGETATFRLEIGNDGPSDAAASVTVTDTLPDGLTYVSSSTVGGPAQWDCTASGKAASCELQDADGGAVTLAAGADAPVLQIIASVDPAFAPGMVTNTAIAESPNDPRPEKPSDSVDVEVVAFADLGITKVAEGTPTAGEDFTWTIDVTNHGPSDSVATVDDPIIITDVLAPGTTFVSATSDGAVCSGAGGTVTCEIVETLVPTESVWVTLVVAVDPAVSGTLTNTASVAPALTPEPADPIYPNEAEAETPTVIELADLTIAKAVTTAPGDIVAGQPITWELTVTNLGPSNSHVDADSPIVVTDTLPDGVVADAASGPNDDWSCTVADDRSTITCELAADLPVNVPQTLTVTGTIDPSTQGDIENVATVAPGLTPQPGDATGPDEARVTSTVTESADLRIVKDISEEIVAGATGRYLLQVFNAGPSTARGVTIIDTLPDVLTFERVVVADGEDSSWTCAPASGDPQSIECAYDGTIVPGPDAVDLEIEVSAASDVSGDVRNAATVAATTPDPDLVNNTDDVTGTFVTTADLVVTKSHDPAAQAVAGEEFTWTITVTNNGPSDSVADAVNPITVRDVLAVGTTFVPVGSSDLCAADPTVSQTVVCDIVETIPAGASVSLDVRVVLDASLAGRLDNAATASPGATADPDLGNNTGTDAVTVTELADLAIAKTVTTPEADIVAGRQITWEVTVSNLGPSDSNASTDAPIEVTDTLPAGVSYVSATGDGWSCEPGAETDGRATIECLSVTDLAVGDAPILTVTGLIAADVQGEIRNDVRVAPGLTPEPEGTQTNNTADAVAEVAEVADLVLSKAVSQTIEAGAGGEYTLTVTNLGPSAARGVALVDTLPAGLTFASAQGDGWTCAPASGSDVICTYDGILAPAATLTLVLSVTADETLQGDIVNTAVVSSSTPDPNLENNTATATGTVAEEADLSIVKTVVGDPVVGETFSYELVVTNAGPATARGILVEDVVPDSLEVVAVSGDGWSCGTDASTGAVSCALPELGVGDSASPITVEVRVLPAAYPEVSNTATVSAATPEDPETLDDNTSTATAAVPALSALTITKTLDDELVTGSQAQYTITVVNEGPTVDPGPITISDPMPEGLVVRSWTLTGADGSCAVDADGITCTIDALEVNQQVTLTLTVDVEATASGEIVNTATASSVASGDPVEASARGEVTVVDLPSTGGTLGLYLPFGLGVLTLGLLALWWARRRTLHSEA